MVNLNSRAVSDHLNIEKITKVRKRNIIKEKKKEDASLGRTVRRVGRNGGDRC